MEDWANRHQIWVWGLNVDVEWIVLILHLGLCVAGIQVIFTLPLHLSNFHHPLAYIHWFMPIHVGDDTIGMYHVAHSTWNHKPHAAVVNVECILQDCHLLPRFGSAPVPHSWFEGQVLDMASDFYINRYINFYLFEDLHPSMSQFLVFIVIPLLLTPHLFESIRASTCDETDRQWT